jgi:hypothetical protein
VYKLFSYFKREANAGMPVHEIRKVQERTAEACDINIGSVQRIISAGSVTVCLSLSLSLCAPPTFVRVMHYSMLQNITRADESLVLKWILRKLGGRVWTGFI